MQLKTLILEGHVDWSKDGMGSTLLQLDDSDEEQAVERNKAEGGKCEFDKTIEGLRLHTIAFIS